MRYFFIDIRVDCVFLEIINSFLTRLLFEKSERGK